MREKFFLPSILTACVIFFVGWYQFFYEPIQREILSMELETRRLREVEREISELKARYGNLSTLAEAKSLQLDEARNFLPPTLMQDEFIDALYRAAEFSNARIISVHAGEEISSKEIQAQIINVTLEADYISLLNFIRTTLDGERLTNLENFSVESAGNKILSCKLSFKIFAEPTKNPAG